MARRMSYSRGKGKIKHNNRDIISANVDKDRIKDDITIIKQPLSEAYEKIFGEAIKEYNAKQTRANRKIDDYFKKLFNCHNDDTIEKNSNKQASFYEYVVGIGDKNDTGYESNPEMAKVAVECLKEYMFGIKRPEGSKEKDLPSFQERNPKFHVFNAVIHQDEATPHLHYDFVPYADGYKTGMSRQQGIAKALEQMSYGKGDAAYKAFTQSERDIFRKICEAHGIEVASEEKGRGYTYTTEEYRKHAELIEEYEETKKQLKEEIVESEADIDDQCKRLAYGRMEIVKMEDEKKQVSKELSENKNELQEVDTELSEKQQALKKVQDEALAYKQPPKRILESETTYADRVAQGQQAAAIKQREQDSIDRAAALLEQERKFKQYTEQKESELSKVTKKVEHMLKDVMTKNEQLDKDRMDFERKAAKIIAAEARRQAQKLIEGSGVHVPDVLLDEHMRAVQEQLHVQSLQQKKEQEKGR